MLVISQIQFGGGISSFKNNSILNLRILALHNIQNCKKRGECTNMESIYI